MSGKKFGLDEKYKALGVGPRTVSINPMQDDLQKLKGMTAAIGAPSKFMQRGLTLRAGADNFTTRSLALRAGVKDASSLLEKAGKSSGVKNAIKKVLTSKPNIAGSSAAAGYEIGKATERKKYGGSMKKMKSGGLSAKQKKIARMAPPPDKITGDDFKAMKVTKANLGLLMSNKKIAGAGLLGLGMLASKKGMFNKGGESKIKKVMSEYKEGKLNIGKSKKKVKSRKQAIAIALSEARKKKA